MFLITKIRDFIMVSLKDTRVWGAVLFLQLASLRVIFKYFPVYLHKFILLYLFITFFLYSMFLGKYGVFELIKEFFKKRVIFVILIILIILINFFVYPIADNLKYQGKGSDQDDALIVTGQNLIVGKNPFWAHTYFFTNPLSPGPGWIILNLPFAIKGLYFFLTPFYIILLCLLLRRVTGSYFCGNIFLILCMSSLAFWETMVVGSDMLAIGILFILSIGAVFYSMDKAGVPLFLSMLLLAFAATSRIVFIYIIPVMGVFFLRHSKFKHLIYLLAALAITVLLHLVFYFWDPVAYTPLHLLAKGSKLLTPGLKLSAVLLTLAVLIFTYLKVKNNISSWLLFFCLSLTAPLLFVSIGDLINVRNYNFALWEGANYLLVLMPIYVVYVVLEQLKFRSIDA
jgi:hypothetical protein